MARAEIVPDPRLARAPMPEAKNQMREESRELYSVAQIQHVMRVEFGRALRYRYPLVCAMVSIDTLGAVRDAYGYDAKERVFQGVVKLLEEATRSSDFLGRTADDRLLAVLPHTDTDGARRLSDRLLREAANLSFDGELGRTKVTLSIGLVSNEHEGLVYHDAMYTATENALSDAIAAGGGRMVEGRP